METRRILIIDDDPRNIFALSAMLRSRGFECIAASGAAEGLQIIDAQKVDCVLIDMMMPEMDGYEAIPIYKSRISGKIPVIAVTAQAMVGDREKCLAVGADNYISKPIDFDLLMDMLNQSHDADRL
jgi:CheY-like chemotaxis protein